MECMCSICLDSLFSVNTDVSITPCGHLYHKNCIENSMQKNLKCPKCKTKIRKSNLKKIHPDIFEELSYSDCSVETNNFLAKVFDYQKQKRIIMLKIIKKLDKENTSLKETNKSKQKYLQTWKLFLKSFQTNKKEWQKKSEILKVENNKVLAELRKLNISEEVSDVSDDSHFQCVNNIEKSLSNNKCSTIETLVNEGLFSILYFYKILVYYQIYFSNIWKAKFLITK